MAFVPSPSDLSVGTFTFAVCSAAHIRWTSRAEGSEPSLCRRGANVQGGWPEASSLYKHQGPGPRPRCVRWRTDADGRSVDIDCEYRCVGGSTSLRSGASELVHAKGVVKEGAHQQ